MGNSLKSSTKEYSYGKHTIAYAEALCSDFSYYQELYTDLLEGPIWAFSSKQVNTKINLYRASDTTAETALKLCQTNNRELRQIELIVTAIRRVYSEVCDENEKAWFVEHLIHNDYKKKKTLEDKRIRYRILSNVCHYMGIPEDGSDVRSRRVNENRLPANI